MKDKLARLLARTAALLALVFGLLPASAGAQAGCGFALGFKAIADQMPETVGRCLEDEQFNPANGNAEQHTTAWHGKGGLLVWRKADNWTAFTDGNWTWVNGPYGLQKRLNLERFAWETAEPVGLAPGPQTVPPAPRMPAAPAAPVPPAAPAPLTIEQCMNLPPNASLSVLEACLAVLEAAQGVSIGSPTNGAEWVVVTVGRVPSNGGIWPPVLPPPITPLTPPG